MWLPSATCAPRDQTTSTAYPRRRSTPSTSKGGPMSAEEVQAFERNPNLEKIVQVRYLDEAGKDPDMETPDYWHFAPMVQRIVDQTLAADSAFSDSVIAINLVQAPARQPRQEPSPQRTTCCTLEFAPNPAGDGNRARSAWPAAGSLAFAADAGSRSGVGRPRHALPGPPMLPPSKRLPALDWPLGRTWATWGARHHRPAPFCP